MSVETDDIKLHSKIDFDDDDDIVESLRKAAILYLKGAGVPEMKDNEEYNLAVKMIVDHWYNNRGLLAKGYEMPYGFASIVVQLKE